MKVALFVDKNNPKATLEFSLDLHGKIAHCGKQGDNHLYHFNTQNSATKQLKPFTFTVNDEHHDELSEALKEYNLYTDMSHLPPPPHHGNAHGHGVEQIWIVRCPVYPVRWKVHPYWTLRL